VLELTFLPILVGFQRSRLFRDYVQETATAQDDCELVQAVECIAALANAELVSSMVLFM
jgi:hypothetical protein